MVFSSEHNIYTCLRLYQKDNYISIGSLECNIINHHRMPFACSAIDGKFSGSLIKLYSEHLERSRIGFNSFDQSECNIVNLITGEISTIQRKNIGYGHNKLFGVMDTTGTASGQSSKKNIEKAFNELIEKNELGLLWYKGEGYAVCINKQMQVYLSSKGIHCEYVRIFVANNLGRQFTVIVILFGKEKEVLSTGVSSNINILKSLENAILEAQLIYHNCTLPRVKQDHEIKEKDIFDYVELLSNKLVAIDIFRDDLPKGIMPEWISNIYCAMLNTKTWQKDVTIRVFSSNLLNCLPNKENIYACPDTTIVRKYSLLDIDTLPDCIVV